MTKKSDKRFTQRDMEQEYSPHYRSFSDDQLDNQIAWSNYTHEFELQQLQIRYEQETDLMNDLLRRYMEMVAEGKVKEEPL